MNYYSQTEFIVYAIALLANISLALVVLRYSVHKMANYLFAFFVLSQIFWITANYFSFTVEDVNSLWLARFVLFSATFHTFSFFWFIHSFLAKKKIVTKKKILLTLGSLFIVSVLTLSPYVFSHLEQNSEGIFVPQPGWAMPVFALFVAGYIAAGIVSFYRKYSVASGIEKVQWRFLAFGLLLTFLLVVVFSFLSVVIFKDLSTVKFGHLYTLPFVILTSYAMIKHRLLDIRAVAAEISVIFLNLIIFIQLINSESVNQFIVALAVLVGTLFVGVLLIRSVRKEVEQKEELAALTEALKKANKKLKKLDETKTEFLSITSHQLRTPLSGIKGYMSMMREGDFGEFTNEQSHVLDRVYSEVERLIRLVQVFLNVSRIESGRLKIDKVEEDIVNLATTVVTELRPTAERKGLKLEYEKPDMPMLLSADFDKLKDVLVNLIDNAIKYTEAGRVWIVTKRIGSKIRVEVHDTGVGIDSEYADHLFEKFSRAKGIAQIDSTGSGLGLFIVKKIIEGHNGKIWAESRGKGKGSVFIFELTNFSSNEDKDS